MARNSRILEATEEIYFSQNHHSSDTRDGPCRSCLSWAATPEIPTYAFSFPWSRSPILTQPWALSPDPKVHLEFWLIFYLVCPWTLLLVPGSGLCTEILWAGACWGRLSLGSAQLLAQHSPVLLTSPLRRAALGLILSSLFMALSGHPLFRSFSISDAGYRQHAAGQYITACEYILRIMNNQVRCFPCASKYLMVVIDFCMFVPGPSNEHTASRQVMETSSNQYLDLQEKIFSSLQRNRPMIFSLLNQTIRVFLWRWLLLALCQFFFDVTEG